MEKDFPVILEGKTLDTVKVDLDDFEDLGTIEDEDHYYYCLLHGVDHCNECPYFNTKDCIDSDEGLEWWQK